MGSYSGDWHSVADSPSVEVPLQRMRRHFDHGINIWYAMLMGICGCMGLFLSGFILYYCNKLRQDNRRKRAIVSTSTRYESSHLLAHASLDWPSTLSSNSSGNLYLSPIPEEFHNGDDIYDEAIREKEFVKHFCDESEEYMWLDKPALYMGKNRLKRMYLLGRASMSHVTAARYGLSVDRRYNQLLCTIFPPSAYRPSDLPLLRSFFKHLQENCPHVLPVLDLVQMPDTNKIICITPYVPQGSLKDYIFHRCKTAMVQIPYHHKYKRHGSGKPLGLSSIARYGRDILLGMLELEQAGLPYIQLQSGNVLLHGDQATLSGYEAIFFAPSTPSNSNASPIQLFGHLLFEMVFGNEWNPNRMRMDGSLSYGTLKCPSDQISQVFDAIFTPNPSTTIESLLAMPLFHKCTSKPIRSFTRRDHLLEKEKDLHVKRLPPEMLNLVKDALGGYETDSIVIQVA